MQLSKTDTVETPVSQKYFYTDYFIYIYMYIYFSILEKVFLMKIFNTVIYLFEVLSVKNCFFTLCNLKFKCHTRPLVILLNGTVIGQTV